MSGRVEPDLETLFEQHQESLEDFWGRRDNRLRFEREFPLFGRTFRVAANRAGLLDALDLCLPMYSRAEPDGHQGGEIRLVVRPAPVDPGPAADDLVRYIQYTGEGSRLAMHYGPWGHCQVDLEGRRAWAVLTPELAERPDLVSGLLLNTVFTNLFIASGLGLLHATCMVQQDRALVLIGPHNSGKSTAALILLQAGYSLLSDSLVYVHFSAERVQLLGFPVGRVKLRRDVLGHFPNLLQHFRPEEIRGETKYTLDVRRVAPEQVHDHALVPAAVDLLLVSRVNSAHTLVERSGRPAVLEAVMANSLYYDEANAWKRNLAPILRLMERARWRHLKLGTEPEGLLAAMDSLKREGAKT